MKRCFVAIEIPEEAREKIRIVQEELPGFDGKRTEAENLHLTLKFLGEIDEEKIEIIKEKLKKIKFNSFEAELGKIGVFSEDFIKIIWIELTNCNELQKKVDDILKKEFESEYSFMGHITIVRVKNIRDKKRFLKELKSIDFEKESFFVNKFYLKESVLGKEGPVYTTIEEYSLN